MRPLFVAPSLQGSLYHYVSIRSDIVTFGSLFCLVVFLDVLLYLEGRLSLVPGLATVSRPLTVYRCSLGLPRNGRLCKKFMPSLVFGIYRPL